MKNARGGWLWLAAGAAVVSVGAAFVACSGSSNGTSIGVDASEEETPPGPDAAGTPDSTVSEPDGNGTHPGTMDAVADVAPDQATSDGGGTDASDGGAMDASEGGGSCTPFDASGLDEASVAAGFNAVWTVYRCFGCHQNASQHVDDAGNGIVLSGNNNGFGDSGMVFPPNLTNDPSTGIGCYTDDQVVNAILSGSDPTGGTLCPSMPKWGNAIGRAGTPMDAGTAKEIVDFLRSLPPVVNHTTDTTCSTPDAGSSDAGDAGSSDAADGGG
jgi:hypothetical protein